MVKNLTTSNPPLNGKINYSKFNFLQTIQWVHMSISPFDYIPSLGLSIPIEFALSDSSDCTPGNRRISAAWNVPKYTIDFTKCTLTILYLIRIQLGGEKSALILCSSCFKFVEIELNENIPEMYRYVPVKFEKLSMKNLVN